MLAQRASFCILISDKVDIEYKHTIHIVIAIITSFVQKSFSKNDIKISKVFSKNRNLLIMNSNSYLTHKQKYICRKVKSDPRQKHTG